jgi:hypothetical protein
VVWNTNFTLGAGEIWYSRGTIDGVEPLPALEITSLETPMPTATLAPTLPAPTTAPERPSLDLPEASQPLQSQVNSLLLGALPALLLVGAIVSWARARSRR